MDSEDRRIESDVCLETDEIFYEKNIRLAFDKYRS